MADSSEMKEKEERVRMFLEKKDIWPFFSRDRPISLGPPVVG